MEHIHPSFAKYAIDYTKLKVGDKLFSFKHGIITLTLINEEDTYPLEFNENQTYTKKGYHSLKDKYPTLYHPSILELFEKLEYPKMMEVSDTENFSDSKIRKVLCKGEHNEFIGYNGSNYYPWLWKYAREIQPKEEKIKEEDIINFLKTVKSFDLDTIIKTAEMLKSLKE